ncbi:hypothetical protein DL98DRAFT_585026 [Cadophora sp. DSE1049]|nr:hypothetical protein DL98DRAFT_585026 [Cadophora sp. DSE1049]
MFSIFLLPLIACLFSLQIRTTSATIENLAFYGVWLGAGSNASILRFESTLIIPSPSPDTTIEDNIQAFWPGLQPIENDGVFQNVVTNQGGEAGEWYLLPFSCCSPAKALTPQMRVHPGDSLTNIFALDVPSGKWYDNYLVTPNSAGTGREDGAAPYGGGFTFDPRDDAALKHKPFTSTLMTIELQERGKWNFGAVEWRNILVEANTTETKWCEDGPVLAGGNNFKRRFSKPTWNTVGITTTCHIAQMIFEGPDKGK